MQCRTSKLKCCKNWVSDMRKYCEKRFKACTRSSENRNKSLVETKYKIQTKIITDFAEEGIEFRKKIVTPFNNSLSRL
jgi:hypothetical protein